MLLSRLPLTAFVPALLLGCGGSGTSRDTGSDVAFDTPDIPDTADAPTDTSVDVLSEDTTAVTDASDASDTDDSNPSDAPSDTGIDAPCPCESCTQAGVAFLTSIEYTGKLEGLEGADARCNELAGVASLEGTFAAWVSDSFEDARTRVGNGPWFLVTGELVACSLADLTDGSIETAIEVNENGDAMDSTLVWTGTDTDGTGYIGPGYSYCGDWTSDEYVADALLGHTPEITGGGFTGWQTGFCEHDYPIYCFQKD